MAKTSALLRQVLLIRKIEKENASGNFPTLVALMHHVVKELSIRSVEEFGSSELTFKRDIRQITDYFGTPISYDRKEKGYFIEKDYQNDALFQTVLESFEILTSIGNDGGMPNYIIPEKRKSSGTEHFSLLQNCIKECEIVSFDYFKYDSETTSHPKVKPYALKESQRRWYLIGTTETDSNIRAYGLDRMSNLNISGNKFKKTLTISEIIQKYEDCFAMFSSEEQAQKIILTYDRRDGNYIKSFPIHHSQKIEKEEENRLTFSFFLKIEPDFLMEILSRTWSVEVIEPLTLRKKLELIFTEAKKRNS